MSNASKEIKYGCALATFGLIALLPVFIIADIYILLPEDSKNHVLYGDHPTPPITVQAEQYSPHVVTIRSPQKNLASFYNSQSVRALRQKIDHICGYRGIAVRIPGSVDIETKIENCVDAINASQ